MFSWYDHSCSYQVDPALISLNQKGLWFLFLEWNSVSCSSEILFVPLVDIIGLTSGLVNQWNQFRSWHVDLIVAIFCCCQQTQKKFSRYLLTLCVLRWVLLQAAEDSTATWGTQRPWWSLSHIITTINNHFVSFFLNSSEWPWYITLI